MEASPIWQVSLGLCRAGFRSLLGSAHPCCRQAQRRERLEEVGHFWSTQRAGVSLACGSPPSTHLPNTCFLMLGLGYPSQEGRGWGGPTVPEPPSQPQSDERREAQCQAQRCGQAVARGAMVTKLRTVGDGRQLFGEAGSSDFQFCSCYFHGPWSSFYPVPNRPLHG